MRSLPLSEPKKPIVRCAEHWARIYKTLRDARLEIAPNVDEFYYAYATGFAVGLAEKVSMGACRALMSAPTHDEVRWYASAFNLIAKEYGLLCHDYPRVKRVELWMVRDEQALDLLKRGIDDNVTRAYLTGLEAKQIDPDYVLEAPLYGHEGNG